MHGPPTPGATTFLTGTIAYCLSGTCCNVVTYAPAFACAGQPTIFVTPRSMLSSGVPDPNFACNTRGGVGLQPTEECPLGAACEEQFAELTTLRGTLVRRADLRGTQQLFIEVSSWDASSDAAGATAE